MPWEAGAPICTALCTRRSLTAVIPDAAKRKSLVTRTFDLAFTSESAEVSEVGWIVSPVIGTLAYNTILHPRQLEIDDLHCGFMRVDACE